MVSPAHMTYIRARIASFLSSEGGLGGGLGEAESCGALAQALTASRTAAIAADTRRFETDKDVKERVMGVLPDDRVSTNLDTLWNT